jgi:hypothetical protein
MKQERSPHNSIKLQRGAASVEYSLKLMVLAAAVTAFASFADQTGLSLSETGYQVEHAGEDFGPQPIINAGRGGRSGLGASERGGGSEGYYPVPPGGAEDSIAEGNRNLGCGRGSSIRMINGMRSCRPG